MPKITLTELRKDLFRLADKALETGEPVVIERNGRTMVLMEAGQPFEHAPAQTHAERMDAFFAKPSPFPPPAAVIHLDTNAVIWLVKAEHHRLSNMARQALRQEPPAVSPIVVLELQLLHDIGRVPVSPETALEYLKAEFDLAISHTGFDRITRLTAWSAGPQLRTGPG
eukprot:gene19727-19625_t